MNEVDEMLSTRNSEIKELIHELSIEEESSTKIRKTLATQKASFFLLFYNLIESIIYASFELLFDEISQYCNDFDLLIAEVQQQYKRYDRNDETSSNDLLNLTLKRFENNVTLFSGNLDARSIRKLLSQWGVAKEFHANGEAKLVDIKNYRNALAHGEKAFKEIGRNYTMNDLAKYNIELYDYLTAVVRCFNDYIDSRMYLKR